MDGDLSELTDAENIRQCTLHDRIGAGRMESIRTDGTGPVNLDWKH